MAVVRPEVLQNLARRRLGLTAESDTSRRRLEEDFGLSTRLINEDSLRMQKDTGDQLASQGLFNSGIRIDEQGNIQREAQQALADVNLNRSRGLEDISAGLARGLADLDFEQAQEQAQANRQEQEDRERRAMLEATRRAGSVGGIGYPGSVIGLNQQNLGNLGAIMGQYRPPQGGGPFNSFVSFRQMNPEIANMLTFFAGGNWQQAESEAIRNGYVLPVRQGFLPGRVGRV